MRILAIDDDDDIRRLFSVALSGGGWSVDVAADGRSGVEAAMNGRPDVVLLDLNLPDMGGEAVLAALRARDAMPVIVVSVRDSEADVSGLLDAGADDYIVKPFHTSVLVSRIRAVLRRSVPESVRAFKGGALELDPAQRKVTVRGVEVRLTPIEFSILEFLSRHPGKIVTRSRILREIWGSSGDDEAGSLRVHISSIRKKIEPEPASPSILLTEPGIGFRLALEFED